MLDFEGGGTSKRVALMVGPRVVWPMDGRRTYYSSKQNPLRPGNQVWMLDFEGGVARRQAALEPTPPSKSSTNAQFRREGLFSVENEEAEAEHEKRALMGTS